MLELAQSTTVTAHTGVTRDEHVDRLREVCTVLERRFVDWLAERDYRLPDEAQVVVTDAMARPDFVYHLADGPVAVFVDGAHHDAASVRERDRQAEDRLMDLGWSVVRVGADDDWAAIVAGRPSVFGKGRDVQ